MHNINRRRNTTKHICMYVQQIKCLQPNIDQKINSQTTLVIEITRAQSCKCRQQQKQYISISISSHILVFNYFQVLQLHDSGCNEWLHRHSCQLPHHTSTHSHMHIIIIIALLLCSPSDCCNNLSHGHTHTRHTLDNVQHDRQIISQDVSKTDVSH